MSESVHAVGEVIEVSLEPLEGTDSTPRWPLGLGLLALAALLFAGAYLATSDGDSELDVAAETVAEAADDLPEDDGASADTAGEDSQDGEGIESDDRDLPVDGADDFETSEAVFEEFAADSAYYGDGGQVIFTGSQFASLGYGESGQTLRTSADGITWDERPFPNLPANSNVYQLAERNGTVVAVVEQWTDVDDGRGDGEPEMFFGSPTPPIHYLASTTDLVEWSYVELPVPDLSDQPMYLNISAVALADSGVVLLTQAHEEGEDEMRILYDAGIIDESNIRNYCGINFDTPGRLDVQLCEFEDDEGFWIEFEEAMETAESDEERAEIERQFDEAYVEPIPEVVATIESGDPLYERLSSIYEGGEEQLPIVEALSGPIDGPFTRSSISQVGYPGAMVEIDGTFVAIIQRWDSGPEGRSSATAIASADGVSWNEVGEVPTSHVNQLLAVGSVLVSVGGDDQGQPGTYVSTDGGATWTSSSLTTRLFNAYPQAATGPVGVAVLIRGGVEPYTDFVLPEPLSITKDGYTLTMTFGDFGGLITLVGPDGTEIHSLSEEEMYDQGNETKVRLGRLSGSQTFLDPESGEDLVTFSQQDWEEAYRQIEPEEPQEIEQRSELSFSADGINWTRVSDLRLDVDMTQGNIELVAVGDDELIVRKNTWLNPPAELFTFEEEGREPTDEEGRALDEWFSADHGGQQTEYLAIPVG